jgi:hypothetical protein
MQQTRAALTPTVAALAADPCCWANVFGAVRLAVVICLVVARFAGAEDRCPPDRLYSSGRPIAVAPQEMYSVAGLQLRRDTLDDARRSLGAAQVTRERGAAGSNVLCYRESADSSWVLELESGPMGGWSQLTGYATMPPSLPNCAVAVGLRNSLLPFLSPGADFESAVSRLGPPHHQSGELREYLYTGFEEHNGVRFDSWLSIQFCVRDDHVVSAHVSTGASN